MTWKKLKKDIYYYEKPSLGQLKQSVRYMALTVDKSTLKNKIKYGLAREITKSKGNPDVAGFIDESKLIIVKSKDLLNWKKVCDLKIKGINKIIKSLGKKNRFFIGLEDPDIIVNNKTKHVYFTIAFKLKDKIAYNVYLGHAQGKSLDNLKATKPVLSPTKNFRGFKELAFSPYKIKNKRICLNESQIIRKNEEIQLIVSTISAKFGKPWKPFKIVLEPAKAKYKWIQGHASPCKIFPTKFINHKGLLVGIINGREKNKGKKYGKFRPGLILFNPKTGEIPWVSPKPLFEDPKARTITFASDLIQINKDEIILYCHVNDSFVRAYKINKKAIEKLIS
ncbi:MAG: hypothetical protein ABIH25_02855 [Candidatus Woesearchaeota archaeon]